MRALATLSRFIGNTFAYWALLSTWLRRMSEKQQREQAAANARN